MITQARTKSLLTYSALSTFRGCPQKYKHRFIDHLKPRTKAHSLRFGQIIHEGLTILYQNGWDLEVVYRFFDSCFPNHHRDADEKHDRILAYVMLTAYAERYANEKMNIVALDVEFSGVIRNPKTGCQSRTFDIAGKANGIVMIDGECYLLEHRTVSTSEEIDESKLWTDTQSALYCYYLRQLGYPIVGVVYNFLVKSRIKQKEGESEQEYEERKAELIAKSKSGKSSAQRQMPESDQDFLERLKTWYQRPEAFERVVFRFQEERLEMLQEEIWEVTQQYLGSRRRDQWFLNTASCFHFGRSCEYLDYCRSGFDPEVCRTLYDIALPHEELPVLGLNLRPAEQKRYEEVRKQRKEQQSGMLFQ